MTPDRLQQWLRRLYRFDVDGRFHDEMRAICLLLGHEPSGDRVMVNPPIDTCWWCGTEYRQPKP